MSSLAINNSQPLNSGTLCRAFDGVCLFGTHGVVDTDAGKLQLAQPIASYRPEAWKEMDMR